MEPLSPAAILAITILVLIAAWYAWPHVCGGSRRRRVITTPPATTAVVAAPQGTQPQGASFGETEGSGDSDDDNDDAYEGFRWGRRGSSKAKRRRRRNQTPVEPFCGAAHASCGF
jgi:hypothetical protein